MFETTTWDARARAGGRVCASRKGGGSARSDEDYPNIIEEPLRVVGDGDDARRGSKPGGKKAGKRSAAGKGARRGQKGSGKKGRG